MVLEAVPDIWAPWATKARQTNPDPRKEAFIQEYGPYAKRYGAMWNIAPEVLLGWGASESNWGAAGSIFGVKQWEGSKKAQTYDTWEAGPNGERIPQKAAFEVYDSPDEAFQALGNLLNTERYRPAFEQVKQTGDSATFLRNINDAGYATDRNWAGSVVAIANSMGDGNFPDPPPAGPGQNASSRMGSVLNGAGGETMPVEELGIRGKVARLVVQKRLDAEQARTAAVDEEARAKLETQLGRPMLDIATERVNSKIKPPGDADWMGTQQPPFRSGIAGMGDRAWDYMQGKDLPPNAMPGRGFDFGVEGFDESATLSPTGQSIKPPSTGDAGFADEANTGDVPYAAGQGGPGTTLQSGQAAGHVGSIFSVAGTQRAQTESQARLAAAAERVGGGGFGSLLDKSGVGGVIKAGAGAVGSALSEVKIGMPDLRVGAGGGVHSANAGQSLPQAVLLGQGQGIPGSEAAKSFLEDKFSAAAKPYDFTRAAGGIGTPGGGQPLSDEGLIQKGAAQVPGAVIPTTIGQAAFNVALGAGPIEKLTGLPLDNLVRGIAERGAQAGAKRAAQKTLEDIAKGSERAAPDLVGTVASASSSGINRAKLGNNAKEARYGQIVRDSMQQTQGPEATAKMEAGLIKTGKTWADLGDSIEQLAPETAPWLQEPASSAVEQGSKAVKPDGSIDYDVLRKEVRQSVESVNAERAGQGAREQMQRARPAIGGEGSMLGKDQSQLRTGAQNPVQPEDIAFGDQPSRSGLREVPSPEANASQRDQIVRAQTDVQLKQWVKDAENKIVTTADNPALQGEWKKSRDLYQAELDRRAFGGRSAQSVERMKEVGQTRDSRLPLEMRRLRVLEDDAVQRLYRDTTEQLTNETNPGNQLKLDRLRQQYEAELVRRGIEPGGVPTGTTTAPEGAPLTPPERPRTQWTVTPKEGQPYTAETLAGPRSSSVEEAQQTFQSEAQRARDLGDQAKSARRAGIAQQAQQGVERLRRPPVGGEGSIVARGARPVGEAAPTSINPLPQSGAPAAEVPPVNLGKKLPAVKPDTLAGFELEPPSSGTPLGRLRQPEDKAKTVVIVHNQPNLDVVGPASNNGQRVGNMWVGGLPDADTWAKMTEDAADVATIFKDSRYYAEVPPELVRLFQITDPQERQRAIAGYAMGNRRTSSERAAGDVLRVEERLAGAQREGLGSMNADIIQNALNWSEDPAGVGPKLFDFEDVLQGKTEARTWAGNDPRAGRPFVADTHSSRDAGFIDPEMKRYIEKKSGKTLDELGLVMDNATDSFNPTEVQYELISRWGNQLADDLNARNWLGKSDWLPSELQAIGWGRVRRELGLADSGMESIRRANTFRVTVPSADAALRARGVELTDQEMRRVSTRFVENAVDHVGGLIPQARFSQLPSIGLDGVHYDVFTSPETAHEVALAVSHSLGQPVITFREAGVSAKTAFNDIGLPSGTFNAEQAQRLTDAVQDYVTGVTYNADGSIKLVGTPTSEKGQKSLQNAIDAAFPDEELLFHAPGRGDIDIVGQGGTHADALSALERGRPDAATALQDADSLRQSWLDAALRDSGSRGPTEFPGPAAVSGSPVTAGRVEAGAASRETGLTAAKQFQFADPFHPTPEELNRFTEIGGTELLTEANRLDQVGVSGKANDWIADAATLAKRLGDPGGELRRQLQQNGLMPAITGGQGGNQQQGQQAPARGPAGQLLHEITSLPGGILGAMRTGFASGDLPVARQGAAFAIRDPKQVVASTMKAIGAYRDDAFADASKLAREADPLYQESVDAGIAYRQAGVAAAPGSRAANFDWMNDSFISKLVNKIPYVERSERGTVEFLNDLMFETYKSVTQPMFAAGIKDEAAYSAVADVINHMAGHSGSGAAKAWGKLNALFSAEYTFSRFNLLADPMSYYRYPDARNLAIQSLTSLGGANLSLAAMAKITGSSTGLWDVNLDPESSDFGQVRIGNTRYDFLGGFGPILKTGAKIQAHVRQGIKEGEPDNEFFNQIVADVGKFFENKESPGFKILTDSYVHKSAPELKEIARNLAPGLATGLIDAYSKNEPGYAEANLALGAALTPFSVGQNTYSTAQDKAEDITKKTYEGKKFDDLGNLEKVKVMSQLEASDARARGGPVEIERKKFNEDKLAAGYQDPPKDKDGNPIKGTDEASKARIADETKARNANNAEVWRKNPELDARKWFFSDNRADPDGGALHSKEAVDKVLALSLPPEREVRYGSADRNLATPEGRKLWADSGKRIEDFYSDSFLNKNKALLDYMSNERFGKNYAELKDYNQKSVASTLRSETVDKSPSLDALHAYLGYGGDSNRKVYLLHSQEALDEVKKLEAKYGKGPATYGYKWELSKDAK